MKNIILAVILAVLALGTALIFLSSQETTSMPEMPPVSAPVSETQDSTPPTSTQSEDNTEVVNDSEPEETTEPMAEEASEPQEIVVPNDTESAHELFMMGIKLYYNPASESQFRSAMEAFAAVVEGMTALIEADVSNAEALYIRALAQYELGEMHTFTVPDWNLEADEEATVSYLEAAWESAKAAVRIDESHSDAQRMIGQAVNRLMAFKSMNFAITNGTVPQTKAAEALKLNPNNVHAYLVRGQSYLFTPQAFGGDLDKAVEAFNKALELASTEHEVFLGNVWLAWAYTSIGNPSGARTALERALEIYPHSQWAQSMLDGLGF